MNSSAIKKGSSKQERVAFENSGWLMYAEYDPATLTLEVGFKDGSVVEHSPVYPQTWFDLKVSPSKGKFYSEAIKKTSDPSEIKA